MNKIEMAEAINNIAQVRVVGVRDGSYPFIGEKGFREKLNENEELAMLSFIMQYTLQEEFEQVSRETVVKNRRGFMSSHAKTATRVAEAILEGAECIMPYDGFRADGKTFTDQTAYALHVGRRYAQSTLRATIEVLISQDPQLAEAAARFSVKV